MKLERIGARIGRVFDRITLGQYQTEPKLIPIPPVTDYFRDDLYVDLFELLHKEDLKPSDMATLLEYMIKLTGGTKETRYQSGSKWEDLQGSFVHDTNGITFGLKTIDKKLVNYSIRFRTRSLIEELKGQDTERAIYSTYVMGASLECGLLSSSLEHAQPYETLSEEDIKNGRPYSYLTPLPNQDPNLPQLGVETYEAHTPMPFVQEFCTKVVQRYQFLAS